MGKVVGIATHSEKKGPMVVYASAKVSFERGIGDDINGATQDDRQVSIITQEGWLDACAELNRKIHWTTRRANLLIEGIDLKDSVGKLLRIGQFVVEITGEMKAGNRMDEERVGLTKALAPDWRGGVTCRLLSEGVVYEGDEVVFYERPEK